MSAVPNIIEGTWDEVLRHADELAGHRLPVTVLEKSSAEPTVPSETADAEADAWVRSLYEWGKPPQCTVVDDSRDSIYADRLDHQI